MRWLSLSDTMSRFLSIKISFYVKSFPSVLMVLSMRAYCSSKILLVSFLKASVIVKVVV